MHCPLCLDTVLDITFHGGIELDICPRCRGVWLDRGELERLGRDTNDRPSRRDGSDRVTTNSDRPRDDRPRNDRPSKQQRRKRLSDRLGDVFEEIIDL